MKKLAFSVLAAVLFISACKKDDNDSTSDNSFTFNNTTVVTTYGYRFDWDTDGGQVLFADVNVTDTFEGKMSAFSISIDTLIDGQTYTLLSKDSVAFNKSKNFDDALGYYKADFIDGEINDTTSTPMRAPKSGTVTVKKSGDNYSIGYTIQFPTTTVTGKFNGKLALQN
ncbi:hypothetical protein SAMN05518672_103316 [Chitinophaga sp. CF118]|uniref:hypothetical protein n=1 Tax=Chitinophaga sp. CF118 TaxID=1884367 RepID=UPI0008EC8013|nr:hypothetical protein [Chitinophaga sp. CF118]SFD81235.1 hypothetical protein SAMN05518672_103316 [Chitinophaga sp. CF118]